MTSPFTEQMLNDFRHQGDPLADEVIQCFATHYNSSIEELVEKLENMIRMPNDDKIMATIKKHFPEDTNICYALEKYFSQAVLLPNWVDKEKLKLGAQVFHVLWVFLKNRNFPCGQTALLHQYRDHDPS